MTELINGRTPEEIKSAVINCDERASCVDCPEDERDYCDQSVVIHGARSLIERLEAERDAALAKTPKWISVEERLPEKWEDNEGVLINYMIYTPEYGVDVGNYLPMAKTWTCVGIPCKVTHWMPLPEPPKGEK